MCSYCGCRSIALIARFSTEHDAIVNAAGVLRRAIDSGDLRGVPGAAADLTGLLERHTRDEERTLFAEMAEDPEFSEHIAHLSGEHREIEAQLALLGTGDVAAVHRLNDLLRNHIDKEENGLFPAAAIALDGAAWDRAQALLDPTQTPRVAESAAWSSPVAPLEVLRRWEDAGAVWRILSRSVAGVDIALLTCSAGEEASRIHTSDPDVMAYVAGREGSD